jgi:hypothetical protein
MSNRKKNFNRFPLHKLVGWSALAIFAAGYFNLSEGHVRRQKMFSNCEEASIALVGAVEKDDRLALLEILGPEASRLIYSGDEAEDRDNRQQFIEKYKEMHRLVREPNGAVTLYVGAENWPTPIPIVRKENRWCFDTVAGRKVILFRRIGKNELKTVAVCRELVDAQNEYHSEPHDGAAVRQYAPRFRSDEGKHNGLYWKISSGEPQSPVGPLLTLAGGENSATETTRPRPFNGYYYRILASQGRHARGGAKNYRVNGKMTGGFAFVAYPAEYRSSGVMTFIVNQDGIVYQKDLGPKTAARAKTLIRYDPDATWKKAN